MKKITKSAELLWAFGIIFVALGVAICSKADLGVSMIAAPAFVIFEALSRLGGIFDIFSVGMVEYLLQGVLLILLCVIIGKFRCRYLLTFAVAIIYGYVLNFFIWLLQDIQLETVVARYILLLIGDLITALGVACFFKTYLPLQVYELFVSELTDRFGLNLSRTKSVFDISLLALSLILAFSLFGDVQSFDWKSIPYASFHSIGLGTLITTAINSPLISLCSRLLDRLFDPSPRWKNLNLWLH